MKDKKDDPQQKNYAVIAVYAFIVIVAGVAAFLIINSVFGFFSEGSHIRIISIFTPIMFGFIIAYLLHPLIVFFEKKIFYKLKSRARYIVSILLAYVVTGVVITLLSFMVIPQVIDSINQLTTMVTDLFSPYEAEHEEDENGNGDGIITEETWVIETDEIMTGEDGEDEILESSEFLADTRIGVALNNFAANLQASIDGLGIDVDIQETINDLTFAFAANFFNFMMDSSTAIFNATASVVTGVASAVFNIFLAPTLFPSSIK